MYRLLSTVLLVSLFAPLYAQREHIASEKMRFNIQDASFIDSQDGSIIPNITMGLRPFVYMWAGPDGFISDDSVLMNIKSGLYRISMNDAMCGVFSDTMYVMAKSNSYQPTRNFVISRVHPNPFTEDVEILFRSNEAQEIHLEIFHSNGQVHSRRQINIDEGQTTVNLNLSSAPAGIYVLNFCNASNCKMTERIIKLN